MCGEDVLVPVALDMASEDGSGVLASTPSGSLYLDPSSPSATARQHCEQPPSHFMPCCNLVCLSGESAPWQLLPLPASTERPCNYASAPIKTLASSLVQEACLKAAFVWGTLTALAPPAALFALSIHKGLCCPDMWVMTCAAVFARVRRSEAGVDDRAGSSGCLDEGARGSASGMLARMAVAKAGNFGRSWSAVERPSPLSESSGKDFSGTPGPANLPDLTLQCLWWCCSGDAARKQRLVVMNAGCRVEAGAWIYSGMLDM